MLDKNLLILSNIRKTVLEPIKCRSSKPPLDQPIAIVTRNYAVTKNSEYNI